MNQKRYKRKLINLLFILVLILFSASCSSNANNLAKEEIKEVALSNEKNEITLTTYAEREIINAEKKIETLKKNNNNVSFGFITDIHGGQDLISTYANINAFRKLGMNSKINFQVCAGDSTTGSDFASGKSLYDLEYYTNLLKSTSAPVLFARGNHDCNTRTDASVAISGEQYYDSVLKSLKGQCTFNENDLGGDYYYKDLEQEKIRVCMLNAFNGKNYEFVFGDKQLEFVADNVLDLSNKSNPNEWQVLFITHTVDETSAHNEVPSDNEKLYSIINAFQEGRKVKVSSKEVDYSKQGKGTVIAIITGHHHMDTTTIKNNILIITVRSASIVGDREGKNTEAFDESDLSFDIFTIDKQNKTLYATKVGRGKDRKWKYDINNLKEENTSDEPNNIDIPNQEEPIVVKTFVNSNNQVVAVVTSNDKLVEKSNKSWKLSKDKKTYIKLLNDVSDGYSTTFTDVKGNKKVYEFNISKLIDTTPPKLDLKYISNEDGTITAEVKADEILKVKSNKSWFLDNDRKTYKYLFALNTKNYTTSFTDLFGNSSSLTLNAEVFKPEIKYVKNKEENSVEAIVTSPNMKFAKTKPSWNLSADGHTYTKKYYKKEDYFTTFTDVYGNVVNLQIKI